MTDHRQKIEASLKVFAAAPVRQAALGLLGTLGYRSDKTIDLEGSRPKAFLDFIAENNPDSGFDQKKALFPCSDNRWHVHKGIDDRIDGQRALIDLHQKPLIAPVCHGIQNRLARDIRRKPMNRLGEWGREPLRPCASAAIRTPAARPRHPEPARGPAHYAA